MANRPASWFRNAAVGAVVLALLMVAPMEWLQSDHSALPLWLHIPLTMVVLTGIGGGAAVAGVAFLEYRERQKA